MSDLLPLFPLPNIVLFPNVFLPLHIFEPRYRDMVTDALASDRLIGMVLLKPGWEHDYERRPPVYPMGCSGVITHVDRLPDGRYNIVLRGLERFRLLEEDHVRPYRRASVEPAAERPTVTADRAVLRRQRSKLEALLAPAIERGLRSAILDPRPEPSRGATSSGSSRAWSRDDTFRGARRPAQLTVDESAHGLGNTDPLIPSGMPDEDLVNALAQYLDLEPIEKQALLEAPCLRSRAESLVELLEMKIMIARTPGLSHVAH